MVSAMYRIVETVRRSPGEDGEILLDIAKGQIYRLNPVGSNILQLLQRGGGEEEITTLLSRQFNVARCAAAADIKQFLVQLRSQGLIEVQAEPNTAV
jgi:hypothetical protein